MAERFRASVDGGSRGNPGKAAWGVAVYDRHGAYVEGHAGNLGHATNNVAEYHGLLEALQLAVQENAEHVSISTDSELMLRQIQGRYRVRHPDLIPLHGRAVELIRSFGSFRIAHVPRERNRDADRLVNMALDRAAAEPVRFVERPDTSTTAP